MAGTGAAPPPAWYPDPGRRHEFRWWDGSRWTEHVSNRQVIGRDPLPPRGPGPSGVSATVGRAAPAPAAAPGPASGPVPGPAPGEEPRFEPGAWLEAFSVFLRRSPGMERALPMSFDVRDAGGTPLLSVVSAPALSAANATRRRAGAAGSDLLLVTPTDVPIARLARSGPGEQFVLLLPKGGVLGWAAVATDAEPAPGGAPGTDVGAAVDALLGGARTVGLTLGTEAAAPPWARLRMLSGSEGEITTTTGLLVATVSVEAVEPAGKRSAPGREHRLSYRTDITPTERLLTVTALIALDLAAL
jgi:hypothetical protein